jgi:hypothetical protein
VGGGLSANGLGPYAQREEWALPNSATGTEISGVYTLAKRGYVSGVVEGFNYFDDLDTLSWATVQANSTTSNVTLAQESWDGYFEMYLLPGTYSLHVSQWGTQGNVGYNADLVGIEISAGESIRVLVFILNRSGVPIEDSAMGSIILAASLFFTTKSRKNLRAAVRRYCSR